MSDNYRLDRIDKNITRIFDKMDEGFKESDGRLREVEQVQSEHSTRLGYVEKRPGPLKLLLQSLGLISVFVTIVVGVIKLIGV